MGPRHDLLIHYKDGMFKIPSVNPIRYNLKDLLDDIINIGFPNMPGLSHEKVAISYKSNVGGKSDITRIWTKRDMRPIFRTKKKEIELFVELENMSANDVGDAVSKTLKSDADMEEELEVDRSESSSMAGNDIVAYGEDNDSSGDESKCALSDYESDSSSESDDDDFGDDDAIGEYCNGNELVVYSNPLKKVKLRKGMVFADVYAFRKKLQEYVISEGFKIVRKKNEKARVTARCGAKGCPWRIHASPSPDGTAYMIKTLVAKHKCVRVHKRVTEAANAVWLADRLVDALRKNPNMNPTEMRNELKRYGVNPPYMQLYRAKKKALMTIEGNHNDSFSLLPKYAEMVERTNPGSLIKLQYHMENDFIPAQPRFRKVFMGLNALKSNFLEGCSPYLGFNASHLNGPFGSVLLAAVGLDGNNGLLPIALAIVDVECKESWGFFFQCLQEMLGGFDCEKPWTFMTGREEGLVEVINELVPNAINRKCCRHIWANMRQTFPDIQLKKLFWCAARSYNYADFDNAMLTLKELNPAAFDWLMEIDFSLWSRHAFELELKNDHVTNNMFKSFNRWVGELSSKPVLTLLDGLRAKIMSRVHIRHEKGNKWKSIVTSNVLKKLNMTKKESTSCTLQVVNEYEFEVHEQNNNHYLVNLRDRECNCRAWDLSGLPCKHAAKAICHKRESIEMYTDSSFYTDKYLWAYREKINTIPDQKFWPPMSVDPEIVLPPRRSRGRPKKNGKKELYDKALRLRKSLRFKCSKCGSGGHNRRTCGAGCLKKYRDTQSLHQEETDASLAEMLVAMKVYTRKRKKNNITSHQDDMDTPLAEVIAARKRSRKIVKIEEGINVESQGPPLTIQSLVTESAANVESQGPPSTIQSLVTESAANMESQGPPSTIQSLVTESAANVESQGPPSTIQSLVTESAANVENQGPPSTFQSLVTESAANVENQGLPSTVQSLVTESAANVESQGLPSTVQSLVTESAANVESQGLPSTIQSLVTESAEQHSA